MFRQVLSALRPLHLGPPVGACPNLSADLSDVAIGHNETPSGFLAFLAIALSGGHQHVPPCLVWINRVILGIAGRLHLGECGGDFRLIDELVVGRSREPQPGIKQCIQEAECLVKELVALKKHLEEPVELDTL